MEHVMRNAFMYLSKSRFANRAAKKYGLRFGAKRFVAGEQLMEAVAVVRELNAKGIVATLDHLGEFTATEAEAAESAAYCIQTLEMIAATGVKSHLSLKLTQLGLDLSPALCLQHMRNILNVAVKHRNFVRIDMEDYAHNEATIRMFKQLREEYGHAIGLVIQAYLYKSEQDLEQLSKYRPNLRLVKGAYKEPSTVAFPAKDQVDANFLKLIEMHLDQGHYAAIATHDERVIQHVKHYVKAHGIPVTQYEFQMLYGIRVQDQRRLADEGYTMRVYVPFGNDWYGYFMRRLAERPANVGFILKSLFKS
jgi:proline dehydrogenase